MSFIHNDEEPEEVQRELPCGIRINMGMVENHAWMRGGDCKYYTQSPTILRLVSHSKKKALSQKAK